MYWKTFTQRAGENFRPSGKKRFRNTDPDGTQADAWLYLLQVDVVQVVARVHGLHHPALGSVEVQGEERRLRHVQELGHGAGRERPVGLEHHLGLQHVAVKTGRKRWRSHPHAIIVCLCILFSQSNQIQYNIIQYNIQNRKTEKV